MDMLLKEIFRRLNIPLAITQLPAERSLINVNKGIDDGNATRISGIESMYPNVVRIPEKVLVLDFMAFTKRDNINLGHGGWKSLKPYSVGIVRGWKILEKNAVHAMELRALKSDRALFQYLDINRADLVIHERVLGAAYVKMLNLNGIKIIEPPFESRNMYIYFHKKHKALVPKVLKIIVDIKKDGTFRRIFKNSLSPYVAKAELDNLIGRITEIENHD